MKNKIIEYINENKVSSVEVSDALSKTGVLYNIKPINTGHFVVGEVEYISTFKKSNWELHKQIEGVAEGKVIYVDTFKCSKHAVLGDVVAKYLMLYKKSKAIIVNGLVRDVHRLRKEAYPIWSTGYTPLGCYNKKVSVSKSLLKKASENKKLYQNSIMVADDSGCTIISKKICNQDFLKKLDFIELQEDIWYFCIDTLKMSTYETICLKLYLSDEKQILPNTLKEKLKTLEMNGFL